MLRAVVKRAGWGQLTDGVDDLLSTPGALSDEVNPPLPRQDLASHDSPGFLQAPGQYGGCGQQQTSFFCLVYEHVRGWHRPILPRATAVVGDGLSGG